MPRSAEVALGPFFDQAAREHATVCARCGSVDRDLVLGARRIRLRFAGAALAAALLPALGPRAAPVAGDADATIRLWEQAATDPPLPPPWRDHPLGPRGLLRPGTGSVLAVHETGSGAVTLCDRSARELLYRVPAASSLPWWERAAPLRPALHFALGGGPRGLVHAGAVGDPERGCALLAGPGGSGKTTVALAGLAAGLRYVADDYLLLEAGASPVARNVFATAKLDDGHVERFPRLGAHARRSDAVEPGEKAVLDVAGRAPGALAEALPVSAVIVPRIRGGRATLAPISPAEALLALAPSTALQIPFDDGAVVRLLGAVVRAVPCWRLDVGDRPAELAAAVDRVLDTVAAAAPPWRAAG